MTSDEVKPQILRSLRLYCGLEIKIIKHSTAGAIAPQIKFASNNELSGLRFDPVLRMITTQAIVEASRRRRVKSSSI